MGCNGSVFGHVAVKIDFICLYIYVVDEEEEEEEAEATRESARESKPNPNPDHSSVTNLIMCACLFDTV